MFSNFEPGFFWGPVLCVVAYGMYCMIRNDYCTTFIDTHIEDIKKLLQQFGLAIESGPRWNDISPCECKYLIVPTEVGDDWEKDWKAMPSRKVMNIIKKAKHGVAPTAETLQMFRKTDKDKLTAWDTL